MKTVALQGLHGGTGTSSIVAGLADALARAGESVLCIDLDPCNLLRLHFNHDWHDSRGWARALEARHPWHEASFSLGERLHFLPYGQPENDGVPALRNDTDDVTPEAWHRRLASLDGDAYDWVLLDVPQGQATLQRQARRSADIWLRVSHADPLCHALLARHVISVDEYLLVNRFTPSSPLQRDIHTLWQAQHDDWLLPWAIHRDEAMFEALAHKRSVIAHRPDSLAAQGIQSLAAWLLARPGEAA